ncbi:MAG: 4Fe-4S binding protein [Planctomycetaceae bacterium]|jgi:iron only hydrogenase large subunit-like protein|nr:4Fe-4S binding protein [Planctomycetaceae bacterium]
MSAPSPVYTTENACQDCYKCIRHCPCRAIRIDNGHAGVIVELCVACGMCVRVCPAKAKKIRSDLLRVKYLLNSGKKVYASLAPSFISYFKQYDRGALAAALIQAGFAGVSETALGAQIVSAETAVFLDKAKPGVYLSSACPAVVDYVRKYVPYYVANIVPVFSPILAHAKLLRKHYGQDIGVVFFGPCAAKKNEADQHPELLDLAVTFSDLVGLLAGEDVKLGSVETGHYAAMSPNDAEEGKVYAVEGGMNDTLRRAKNDIRYISVSGLHNLERLFRDIPDPQMLHDCKIFAECLACSGGCINGPAMSGSGAGTLAAIAQIVKEYKGGSSIGRQAEILIESQFLPDVRTERNVTENDIKTALVSVGKFVAADELNCGGCGYSTCREFAKALLTNKAETEMCVSYLRQLAQRKSNALIRYIPAGVVIVDRNLKVLECNKHFAELFDEDILTAFETCGLVGAEIRLFVEFSDLIASILNGGGALQRHHLVCSNQILNVSIFTISAHQSVGVIVQNVTNIELHREQVSEKARAVIQKNIVTCQQIARSLGEHMAETEILLREIAGTYSAVKE